MLQRGQERKRKCWSQQRLDDEAGEEETQKKRFIIYSRSVKATETTVRSDITITSHIFICSLHKSIPEIQLKDIWKSHSILRESESLE